MEMTKKEEKEIGTLLGVGTAFIPVHTFNKEDYVALFAFKETVKGLEKDLLELEEENKKLKSDLEECECSFGFESDEVGFWKREYKRLKKWIKDHCKGYGNLSPEDEMKRQWKKADKKRK